MVFDMKHRIKKGPYPGFHTHDEMDDKQSWADICFLGRDKFTFWNATLVSPADAREEILSTRAWEVTEAIVPLPLWEKGVKFSDWLNRPRETYPEFDGRTHGEQINHLVKEWKSDQSLGLVHLNAQIDYKYQFGIGLYGVVDAPYVTVEAVDQFIEKFRDLGEVGFYEDVPVSWELMSATTRLGNLLNI